MGDQQPEKSRPGYHGRVVEVFAERVQLPNQAVVELDVVRHPGGAAVVALDEAGRVCLLRQYRHAAGGWLWELPAGKLEPEEPAQRTAERELAEEAGVSARQWNALGRLHSSPGVMTEVIYLYLAQDLSAQPMAHEPGELIEVHWLALDVALEQAYCAEITDAKTLIGLFRAAKKLNQPTALRGAH